jgi:3-phosphoshikimate 1-carboxyvinyltransferase
MATIKVRKLKSIPAEITVPGDKSISHRSVMFAGLAKGTTIIDGFLPSEDCLCTVKAMQASAPRLNRWRRSRASAW